jgi:AAA15 family ATPase/GTPase
MIHKLILKNFKRIKEETFHFQDFDLIVGANNSGKSTALQALAIWQYCVDQFKLSRKKGKPGYPGGFAQFYSIAIARI